jgi:uncharacterized protein YndB with AHSA1/START domain
MAELEFTITRLLPADCDAVFAAFSGDRLAPWWGPDGFSIPESDFEPRTGARYRIAMLPPGGEQFELGGRFLAVDRPALLAFTFVWEPPDPDDVETTAEVTLRAAGGSSELTLVQRGFATAARRDLHHDGWSQSLDKLERLLAP